MLRQHLATSHLGLLLLRDGAHGKVSGVDILQVQVRVRVRGSWRGRRFDVEDRASKSLNGSGIEGSLGRVEDVAVSVCEERSDDLKRRV